MLFGAREGEVRRFEAAGVPDLALTGLNPPSAAAVLAAGGCGAAPPVRERLLAEPGGNPLALLELPHGLSQAQLEGRAALPEAIPLSPQLEGVFRQRIRPIRVGRISIRSSLCRRCPTRWKQRCVQAGMRRPASGSR
jgi:hypothetical protein